MKRCIFIIAIITIFLTGCNENKQKRTVFNVQDLSLGMQKFQVEQICNGSLELVSSEIIPDSNGCSKVVYRMWPNETKTPVGLRCISGTPSAIWAGGKDIKPYLVTFIAHPPLTRTQAEKIIADANITDTDDFRIAVQAFDGYCPTSLFSVAVDNAMMQSQIAEYQQNMQNYRGLTEQRQPPTVIQPQPVIIQSPQNQNYWQEQRARQEYLNNILHR